MAGPAPGRQGGRRRRNKTDEQGRSIVPDVIQVGDIDWDEDGDVANLVPAPEADEEWHPIAKQLYESMQHSAQRLYYEPSDWALAYLVCDHITRELNPKFVGFKKVMEGETLKGIPILVDETVFESVPLTGGSLSAIMRALEKLMVTEVDRRKARVEIERGAAVEDDRFAADVVADRMTLIQGGQA